jgi:hypothetical protein
MRQMRMIQCLHDRRVAGKVLQNYLRPIAIVENASERLNLPPRANATHVDAFVNMKGALKGDTTGVGSSCESLLRIPRTSMHVSVDE